MENTYWKLISAKSLQKKYPGRYLRPTNSELLLGLKKGNCVQVIAKKKLLHPKSIRVKLINLEIVGRVNGLYHGRLSEVPLQGDELDMNRLFAFRPEHVLSITLQRAPIFIEQTTVKKIA